MLIYCVNVSFVTTMTNYLFKTTQTLRIRFLAHSLYLNLHNLYHNPHQQPHLNKVHRNKPHEVPVFGQLFEVQTDSDWFFQLVQWNVANVGPGTE